MNLDFETWESKNLPLPPVILSEVEGSVVALSEPHITTNMGAPGLDFETWESTNLPLLPVILSEVERSVVVLGEPHTTTNMGAPGLDFETWESKNLNLRVARSPAPKNSQSQLTPLTAPS